MAGSESGVDLAGGVSLGEGVAFIAACRSAGLDMDIRLIAVVEYIYQASYLVASCKCVCGNGECIGLCMGSSD